MAEQLFLVVTYSAIPFWLLLLVFPRWKGTQALVHSVWVPAALAVAYAMAQAIDENASPDAGFHSLAAVQALFGTPEAVLGAWIHFVVVDLFVGAWQVRDAQRNGIRHGFVVPCLLVTFALAPLGLLLYFVVRLLTVRSASLQNS